ncbi:signal peptidase I [Anaerosporobacter sp.]
MNTNQETVIPTLQQTNEENIEQANTELKLGESEEENKKVKPGKDKKKVSFLKELLIWICIFLICFKVVPTYILERTLVKGSSMQNTLQNKEQLMVEKLTYQFSDPKRFDIVILMPFGDDVDEYFIKRVIGLPGETIQIEDEKIYINGKILEENYGKEPIQDGGIATEPLTLADNEYFVMGDNRNGSNDSRADYIGPIKRELIKGKAFVRIWPLNKIGLLD